MHKTYRAREEYGDSFISSFDDGLVVPWKPLSVGDYIKYDNSVKRGFIPLVLLENEIFKKCVLDESLTSQIDLLKAGTVTTVVQNIWQYSGPTGIDSFNDDLNIARSIMANESTSILHELVQLIMSVLPYRPEEIYAMDYETFLLRVAQAEKRLLEQGVLKEPVQIQHQGKQVCKPGERAKFANLNKEPKKVVNAKDLWDKQQADKKKPSPRKMPQVEPMPNMPTDRWWKTSPALENQLHHNINFNADAQRNDSMMLDSHDLNESPEMQDYLIKKRTAGTQASMIEDTYIIYADLIAALEAKKKKVS